jgi:hypothetical protein
MPQLQETIDRGVDSACGGNCHFLCLSFFLVAGVRSGFVLVARASGLEMGVGRFPKQLRGVGVIAVADTGLDTMRRVEVLLGAGLLRLAVPGMAVGVFINR